MSFAVKVTRLYWRNFELQPMLKNFNGRSFVHQMSCICAHEKNTQATQMKPFCVISENKNEFGLMTYSSCSVANQSLTGRR